MSITFMSTTSKSDDFYKPSKTHFFSVFREPSKMTKNRRFWRFRGTAKKRWNDQRSYVQIIELSRQLSWEISSRVSAGCKRTSNNRAEHVSGGSRFSRYTFARVAERRKGSQRSEDTLCRVRIQITTRVILMWTTQDISELMSKFRI